jgi:hypothetical protein
MWLFVHYKEIKREVNRILIHECRCDERLRGKPEGSTRLTYTGLPVGLEHLKIETSLWDKRVESVMCCVIGSLTHTFFILCFYIFSFFLFSFFFLENIYVRYTWIDLIPSSSCLSPWTLRVTSTRTLYGYCSYTRIVKLVFWPGNYLRNRSSFVSGELHAWIILKDLLGLILVKTNTGYYSHGFVYTVFHTSLFKLSSSASSS